MKSEFLEKPNRSVYEIKITLECLTGLAGAQNSRLDQVMFRNIKTVDANANGTSGYLLKKGKNSGKILKHIKKETGNI